MAKKNQDAASTTVAEAKPAKSSKKQANGDGHGVGLNKPQLRLLKALCEAKEPLTTDQLAERGAVAKTWVVGHVGKACAANKVPSLAERGLARAKEVRLEQRDDGSWITRGGWEATADGKKALAKAEKEAAAVKAKE